MSDDATIIVPRGGGGAAGSVGDGRVRPGMRLNGIYEIDRLIGVGGMSEIYRGHNIQTEEAVAIKVVLPAHAADERMISLFRREALTLGRLGHPAIVRYHVFTHDAAHDLFYLAMEFVDGPTLRDVLAKRPLTQGEAATLVAEVARGMAAVHREGVIHRDLAPDNVVLVDGAVDRPKVIDFGIARGNEAEHTLLESGFAGKLSFVSPEQLGLYGGEVTARSDIYSLGLVLAAALLGRPLAMGGNHAEVVRRRQSVPDLTAINPGVRPVLERMLRPDPAERYATMDEVARALEVLATTRTGRAAKAKQGATRGGLQDLPPTPAPRSGRWARRATIVALLALAGGGAWGLAATERGTALVAELRPALDRLVERGRDLAGSPDDTREADGMAVEATEAGGAESGEADDPGAAPRPTAAGQRADDTPANDEPEPTVPPREVAVLADAPPEPVDVPPSRVPPAAVKTRDPSDLGDPSSAGSAAAQRPTIRTVPIKRPPIAVDGDASTGVGDADEAGRLESERGAVEPPPKDEVIAADDAGEDGAAIDTADDAGPSDPLDTPVPAEEPAGEPVDKPVEIAVLTPDPPPLSPSDSSPPPERESATPIEWVGRFGPDSCFHARAERARGRSIEIEGFGRAVAPFEDMDRRFAQAFGFEASIGARIVTPDQCPLVDLARAAGDGAAALSLTVRSDALAAGEPLLASLASASGDLGGGASAALFVATPDGAVVNVSSLGRLVDGAVMLEIPAGAFSSGAGDAYLLVAVVSDRALAALDVARTDDAGAFSDRLLREADEAGAALAVALKYLKVG